MVTLNSIELEGSAIKAVAEIMAASARTAPKARGIDNIETLVVDGPEKDRLAEVMEEKGARRRHPLPFFKRDAENVRRSSCVLLIGVRGTEPKRPEDPLDCGACGCETCASYIASPKRRGEDFLGPLCVWNVIDLGIALGSAAKIASLFNIDNRLMYTIGAAAKEMNLLQSDVIVGIPLAVSGKSIFYDRK